MISLKIMATSGIVFIVCTLIFKSINDGGDEIPDSLVWLGLFAFGAFVTSAIALVWMM